MKKLFGFMMIGLVSIGLTGCGNGSGKQLKCTGTMNGQDATVKATVKGDKITNVSVETVTEASSNEEAKASATMLNGMGSLAGEGMKMSAKANGKKVTTTLTMDISKMSKDDLEDEFDTDELTKDKFIAAMKDEGLTCK